MTRQRQERDKREIRERQERDQRDCRETEERLERETNVLTELFLKSVDKSESQSTEKEAFQSGLAS